MVEAAQRLFCIKGKAGLGNRMLAAVSGILYADLAGRTPIVDWSDQTYSDDAANVFPRLFVCPGSIDSIPDLAETSVVPKVWIGRLDKSSTDLVDELEGGNHSSPTMWRKHSVDLGRLDYPERLALMWSFTHQIRALRPHFKSAWAGWARLSDEAILSRLLRERMTLHPAIIADVDKFAAEHFAGEVIGVHVRYMDRKTSIRDFLRHIDRKIRHHPDALIFLATDNKAAEEVIRARYPRVVTTPKWFPETGVSMHQNPECPDKLQNAIEALRDMYLLARCQHLIFPGSSTFSWISSLVTDMPRRNIIDIERYSPRIQFKKLVKKLFL